LSRPTWSEHFVDLVLYLELGRAGLVVGDQVDEAREHLVVCLAATQCEVPERDRERERVLRAVVVVDRCREQRDALPHFTAILSSCFIALS
jgi:hypothetical protein